MKSWKTSLIIVALTSGCAVNRLRDDDSLEAHIVPGPESSWEAESPVEPVVVENQNDRDPLIVEMRLRRSTGDFGSGVDGRMLFCAKVERFNQNSLKRKVWDAKGVNPRCLVRFSEYRPIFGPDNPLVEPRRVCVEILVSSLSGILTPGDGIMRCEVSVKPMGSIAPYSNEQ